MEDYRAAGMKFIVGLEHRLEEHRGLIKDSPSLADMALLPFVRQFAKVDEEWFMQQTEIPHVISWLAGFMQSDLFHIVMEKFTPWVPGDEVVYFGEEMDV